MSRKVPENYFENLGSRIHKRILELEDDINNNAPILSAIEKDGIYKIPEHYFSNLQNRLVKKAGKSKVIYLGIRRIALAASIALIMGVVYSNWNMISGMENENTLAETDILDYYIENADELDLYELEANDLLLDSEIAYFDGLDEEDMETYLSTVIDEVELAELASIEQL